MECCVGETFEKPFDKKGWAKGLLIKGLAYDIRDCPLIHFCYRCDKEKYLMWDVQ